MLLRGKVLTGLEVNASWIRAVAGAPTGEARALQLEDGHAELPLALSLEGKTPQIGSAGMAACRRAPHLTCLHFLPHLGTMKLWRAGRHCLNAIQALELVFQKLEAVFTQCAGVVFTLPNYLTSEQIEQVVVAAEQIGVPLLGTVATPLALAMAAFARQPWSGSAILVDVDDYALTLTPVQGSDSRIKCREPRILGNLSVRVWKERIIAGIADRCIRQSRRDPRDCASADQILHDKLEEVMNSCRHGRTTELAIQLPNWFQNLFLQPEDVVQFCSPLIHQVVNSLESLWVARKSEECPGQVVLSAAAGRLPGLVTAVQACLNDLLPAKDIALSTDFGEGLLDEEESEPTRVLVLPPDAAARAGHCLAGRFFRQELEPGHLDQHAPMPPPQTLEAGPARLHYQGQDFLLNRSSFILGRQPTCDLVFNGDQFPNVSGWHCEISYEHHAYVLRDRSRKGTLVNDRAISQQAILRPGDWVRLGRDGPVLRFLGQEADPRRLMTTA